MTKKKKREPVERGEVEEVEEATATLAVFLEGQV